MTKKGCDFDFMRITNIEKIQYKKPIPVYDVINANPYNNFLVKIGGNDDHSYIVSHNCGLMDEVD